MNKKILSLMLSMSLLIPCTVNAETSDNKEEKVEPAVYNGVDYSAVYDYQYYINELPILVTAIKAIQEQQKQIEQLKEKDKQKDEIISNLIERIETLEKEVNNANS